MKKTTRRTHATFPKDAFPSLLKELQNKLDENGKGCLNLISGFAHIHAQTCSVVSEVIINTLSELRSGGSGLILNYDPDS